MKRKGASMNPPRNRRRCDTGENPRGSFWPEPSPRSPCRWRHSPTQAPPQARCPKPTRPASAATRSRADRRPLDDGGTLSLHVPGEGFARFGAPDVRLRQLPRRDRPRPAIPRAASSIASARQYAIERAEACQHVPRGRVRAARGQPACRPRPRGPPARPGVHGLPRLALGHARGPPTKPASAATRPTSTRTPEVAAERGAAPRGRVLRGLPCAGRRADDRPQALRRRDEAVGRRRRRARRCSRSWRARPTRTATASTRGAAQPAAAKSTATRRFRGRCAAASSCAPDVEAHRLADKAQAIKDCDSCHRYGAEPFQNVTVSITGPDGRPVRYPAHKDILGSALAVQSLPEFYAIGGTRSRVLDVLLVLALLGGVGVPVGHMTMKWLFRKYRARPRALRRRNDAELEETTTMQRIYVHPLPVRIWHWINALGFVLLILTGVQIRYVGPDRRDVVPDRGQPAQLDRLRADRQLLRLAAVLPVLRQDQGLSPRTEPDEAFPRQLAADAVLRLRHLPGRPQPAPRQRLPQVQPAAEHDVPDHHDAAACRCSSSPGCCSGT